MNARLPGQSEATILIVDDDMGLNKLFQFYLKSDFEGKVISAYDGVDAVAKCKTHDPDLVLMDIKMPTKDGISAARELRADGFTNPILIVSAYADLEEKNCFEAGADAVIEKPVNRDKLLSSIEKLVGDIQQTAA